MRHGKKINHLGRKSAHRKAMLSNMASSLVLHKKINTTLAKAKALRTFIEPLITKAKSDTTHSRRTVFKYLKDKYAVTELFRDVAPKIADRDGGYTRILKTGNRLGDNADMCLIELVDFNESRIAESKPASTDTKKKTRRGRRKAGETGETVKNKKSEAKADDIQDAEVIEEKPVKKDTKSPSGDEK
jgi:large subunit ribosomal protein L17